MEDIANIRSKNQDSPPLLVLNLSWENLTNRPFESLKLMELVTPKVNTVHHSVQLLKT